MIYVFRCPECEYRVETPVRDPAPTCPHVSLDGGQEVVAMIRDYRAENAGLDLHKLRGSLAPRIPAGQLPDRKPR